MKTGGVYFKVGYKAKKNLFPVFNSQSLSVSETLWKISSLMKQIYI